MYVCVVNNYYSYYYNMLCYSYFHWFGLVWLVLDFIFSVFLAALHPEWTIKHIY